MGTRALHAAALAMSLLVGAAAVAAPQPTVGEKAPFVWAKSWLNVAKGEDPATPEKLKGKVVMVEFWGTWCGPCVRAMPHVQELNDRYRARGLVVLAISYETPDVLEPFLAKNGWTMAVGSDPDKACIGDYDVRSWPTSAVIDKEGKLAYLGDPYDVENAVEKALGLESSPGTLLSQYLAASAAPSARAALDRLVEKAVPDFDVRAWAADLGGAKDAKVVGKVEIAKALADFAKAPPEKRRPLLDQLASGGPPTFDLLAWARDVLGRDFPIQQKEFADLLAAKRFDAAVDAVLDRRPSPAALSTAAKCIALAVHCTQHALEEKSFARKAMIGVLYVFPGKQLSEERNKALWDDLSVSGVSFSEDRKHVLGILIAGEAVLAKRADSYVARRLARSIVMAEFAKGDAPVLAKLAAETAAARDQIAKELKAKYGD